MKHYWKFKSGICFKCRATSVPGPYMYLVRMFIENIFVYFCVFDLLMLLDAQISNTHVEVLQVHQFWIDPTIERPSVL